MASSMGSVWGGLLELLGTTTDPSQFTIVGMLVLAIAASPSAAILAFKLGGVWVREMVAESIGGYSTYRTCY